MSVWLQQLTKELDTIRSGGAYRVRRTLGSAQASMIDIDGQTVVNFSSNDYLGLANHPKVLEAFVSATKEYGVGAGASHLVAGHHQLHQQLEDKIATFTGRDRALVLTSGYVANTSVLQTLLGKNDTVFADKLNHASLIDGAQASGADMHRYRHCDTEHLQRLLESRKQGRVLIATDSVFSMDGDIAPLLQLAQVAEEHQAVLMVDDAHGFGVLGNSGAGASEHFDLSQKDLPILMGTLGKAMGVSGAFIAGSHDLIEMLVQRARHYIYTTAAPPAMAAAAIAAIDVAKSEPARREKLATLIKRFQSGVRSSGIGKAMASNKGSSTPIQPLLVGSNTDALDLSQYLLARDIFAVAIRPPTVPQGTARLRIGFSANHTSEQVDNLLNVLEDGWRKVVKGS